MFPSLDLFLGDCELREPVLRLFPLDYVPQLRPASRQQRTQGADLERFNGVSFASFVLKRTNNWLQHVTYNNRYNNTK